jgi:hypothetical protein
MLATAIPEAVAPLAEMETEWDADKLAKKLKEYFNKASKNLTFRGKALPDLVNEYADNAMGSIFAGLGDREWLYTGQADFLLLVDAGIKDTFPAYLLKGVQQLDFEQMVLAAYDRAFDEQRFCPILSEAVPAAVSGPKIKKKVWNAIDQGRKDAVMSGVTDIEEFTNTWINTSIAHLSEASQGSPEATMAPELAVKLFQTLLEGNALPLALTQEAVAPVHLVEEAVSNAYTEHTVPEEAWASAPPAKKQKAFSAW